MREIKSQVKTTSSLLTLIVVAGVLFSSNLTSATSASTATASVKVASACTMSISGGGSYSATIPNGTSSEITGSTFSVTCNDANGFALYAVGNSNNTLGNTNLIGTSSNIATNTSGNDSYWAMKVNPTSGNTPTIENSFNNYHVVPNAHTKVASYNQSTGSGSLAVQATYKASISTTQLAGNYLGQVKYTLVHPVSEIMPYEIACDSGRICYNPNTVTVEGSMGKQPFSSSSATSATLLASNFSREGYGFAGWSDAYDYDTNPNAHFYGPQEDITFAAGQYTGSNPGLSLYAVWVKSEGSLQDSTKIAELCGTGAGALTPAPIDGTANLTSVSALTDQRDNETYAIAKLADGKCWMIENLRLESTNSDNSTGVLAQGYGTSSTYGNFYGLADAESADFTDYTTYSTYVNSLYYSGTQEGTASIDIGISNYPGYRIPRYNNLNTPADANNRPQNPTSDIFIANNTTVGMYSYGNYYTWHAAIADTAYYSSGDHGTTSLCPTGWRLPIGGQSTANNSFGALSIALGGPAGGAAANNNSSPTGTVMSKTFRSYPNNFLYSGYFYRSSARNRGSAGYYYSSTAQSYYKNFGLSLGSSGLDPGTVSSDKCQGKSIRCIALVGS